MRFALRYSSLTPRDFAPVFFPDKKCGKFCSSYSEKDRKEPFSRRVVSFRTEWFRGFQDGDPAQDKMVIVEAFDSQDHKIELYIGSEPAAKSKPSQTDINQILLSLRPASPSQ